VAVISGG